MISLSLRTDDEIIEKIFVSVCHKLHISLDILKTSKYKNESKVIIIDENCEHESLNFYKDKNTLVGVITTKSKITNKSCDFIIPRPFLPSQLLNILHDKFEEFGLFVEDGEKKEKKEDMKSLWKEKKEKDKKKKKKKKKHTKQEDKNNKNTNSEDANSENNDYVKDLKDMVKDMQIDDESIVRKDDIGDGGRLNQHQIHRLKSLIDNTIYPDSKSSLKEKQKEEKEELLKVLKGYKLNDLALNTDLLGGVKDINIGINEPINMILSSYSIKELEPLLRQLDKNLIDAISEGGEITLDLQLGNNKKSNK